MRIKVYNGSDLPEGLTPTYRTLFGEVSYISIFNHNGRIFADIADGILEIEGVEKEDDLQIINAINTSEWEGE